MVRIQKLKQINLYVILVMTLSLLADIYVEWKAGDSPLLYQKSYVNIFIILVAALLCRLRFLRMTEVLSIAVYSIILSILLSLPIRMETSSLIMDSYFIKMQLIIIIFMLISGILVHPNHIIYILIINSLFILSCVVFIPIQYPLPKYLFYFIVTTGTGIVSRIIYMDMREVKKNLDAANELVSKHYMDLVEINKQKDQLFRIISHDIKTPFNQISMVLSMLNKNLSDEEFDEFTGIMQKATLNGNNLLQDLMIWARAQASDSKPVIEKISAFSLVEKEIEFFSDQARSKSITINNLVTEEDTLQADPHMTATIIRNFISNAIKFSHRNSPVDIRMKKIGKDQIISVQDYGMGMEEKYLSELLNDDKKIISTNGTEKEEGTGFGVRICQKLAENQGGIITIDSNRGHGSVFSLVMPIH